MRHWTVNLAVVCATLAGILFDLDGSNDYALSCIVLAVSVMSVFKARKDWYMFAIYSFILYCTYSIHMSFYLRYYTPPYLLMQHYIGTRVATLGLHVNAIFAACMFVIIPQPYTLNGKRPPMRSLLVNNRDNPCLVAADILLMLWILVYSFGNFNFEGTRGGNTAEGEFSSIFIIVGAYFAGKRKSTKFALILMAALYTLKGFLMGERIAGLQLIIMVMFTFYAEKLSMKKLFLPGLFLFILMRIIGDSRGNFSLSVDAISSAVEDLAEKKLVFDTCYAAWHTSMTILNCLDFSGWNIRMWLFGRFWQALLISSRLIEFSHLANYADRFFDNWGGGMMPAIAYFYLGMPGVILMCAWLGFLFRQMRTVNVTDNGFVRCMAICIVTLMPRWYLYNLYTVTRSVMQLGIGYFMFDYTDRAMKLIATKIHRSISEQPT